MDTRNDGKSVVNSIIESNEESFETISVHDDSEEIDNTDKYSEIFNFEYNLQIDESEKNTEENSKLREDVSLEQLIESENVKYEFNMLPVKQMYSMFSLTSYRDRLASLGMELLYTPEDLTIVTPDTKENTLKPIIDRGIYYQLHELYDKEKKEEMMKNSRLQAKMAKYFLRRKMYYVFKEKTIKPDIGYKYARDLDLLGQLIENSEQERQLWMSELDHLRHLQKLQSSGLNAKFLSMQTVEQEFGSGLTFLKTGRRNMEKTTEEFIKRQKSQLNTLTTMRIDYIHLRNIYNDKVKSVEDINNIGIYGIMDYVQLKHDNILLMDRLDEKETELAKLRISFRNTIQALAHFREKSTNFNIDITTFRKDLDMAEIDLADVRQQLSYLKRERDLNRKEIRKEKFDYGLLTRPKMLRDMESELSEMTEGKQQLIELKKTYFEECEKILAIKKNLEYHTNNKHKKQKMLLPKLSEASTLSTTDLLQYSSGQRE